QSRKMRIAKGSGTNIQEVNRLVKQFDDMRKVMKKMNDLKGNPRALMQMQQMASKMRGKGFGM
ncbi:MAG: signal recognition particle protein, partial [Bacteroidales bacterium]|nr:signal recognition particle protein [Bacteroidales bacterium]